MNRARILQVRLDRDLGRALSATLEAERARLPAVTESVVVRVLLREALAARRAHTVLADEQGFTEGWLRGYGEAKRAFHQALGGASAPHPPEAGPAAPAMPLYDHSRTALPIMARTEQSPATTPSTGGRRG